MSGLHPYSPQRKDSQKTIEHKEKGEGSAPQDKPLLSNEPGFHSDPPPSQTNIMLQRDVNGMLRERDFVASDISTPATTKRLTNYEGFIEEFEAEKWTYIPMPEDGKYYNVKTDAGPQNLAEEQIIEPDLHLLDVMELLCDQPFLLTNEGDSYEMVNLSNLNKREVKDFLYPLFSRLAEQLAYCIEDRYQNPEDMIGMVGTKTLGTWFKAQRDDVELHIAEFLTLSNMIGIIKGNDPLMDKCGFQDNDAVDGLGGVKNLRNRVMHGNRTLVNNQEKLEKHLDRIQRAERILNRLTET